MANSVRPGPLMHQDHLPFWDGTSSGKLLVQQCSQCGVVRWPPRILCGSCLSRESAWVAAPTTGALFSWTVIHHTTLPGFRDETPYAVGLVELHTDGGDLHMLGGISGCALEDLSVGQEVRAHFDGVDGSTLVNWEVVVPEGRSRPEVEGEL